MSTTVEAIESLLAEFELRSTGLLRSMELAELDDDMLCRMEHLARKIRNLRY